MQFSLPGSTTTEDPAAEEKEEASGSALKKRKMEAFANEKKGREAMLVFSNVHLPSRPHNFIKVCQAGIVADTSSNFMIIPLLDPKHLHLKVEMSLKESPPLIAQGIADEDFLLGADMATADDDVTAVMHSKAVTPIAVAPITRGRDVKEDIVEKNTHNKDTVQDDKNVEDPSASTFKVGLTPLFHNDRPFKLYKEFCWMLWLSSMVDFTPGDFFLSPAH